MSFDFGGTLRRAWEITWKHKILWIFGILSAIAGGRASFNVNFGGSRPRVNPTNVNPFNPNDFPFLRRNFPNLDQTTIIAIVLGVICVGLIVAVTLYVLHVIGRGGLIGGIQMADSTGQVSFGQAWGVGVQHFWTVLLIGLIVAIIGLLIASASFVAFLSVCLTPLSCLGFLLIAVLGVFTYLAQIAAVTENLSIGDAMGRALQIVQANLASVVLLGILLVIIGAVVGLIVAVPFIFALAPLAVAAIALGTGNPQAASVSAIVAGLCLVVWIPVAIVLGGILETWIISTWTLAFKQFSARPGTSPAAATPMAS
jgi:hypothetical protein